MSECSNCPSGGGGVATLVPLPGSQAAGKTVAVIGPPNSGKSTLFNRLTGLHQKVANFPGVTVEHRIGKAKLKGEHEVFLVDLPGVYSLTPHADDEQVTADVLKGERPDLKPD